MENNSAPEHLAWHETLDMHELVASQSIGLMKIKKTYPDITDPELKQLYKEAINGLSNNVAELLEFYPLAPRSPEEDDFRNEQIPFHAGDLLALFKSGVRNYSIAITETATPSLRAVLKKQLIQGIDTHAKIFTYMYKNGFYPAYNLERLLQNDVNLASKALNEPF
ncbi:spore coat protein [Alkalihalobacillus oceani]|uniref:Spore coat protein n=1 Tax=Halalkalibacter oceani TaxID=1653776 RepID=A0A9X2ISG3_9BACI|nr:spore coat protein [Halalkalibacter oceani]MCM3716528.1 spore coat protein [Halalkalibacter oceani]